MIRRTHLGLAAAFLTSAVPAFADPLTLALGDGKSFEVGFGKEVSLAYDAAASERVRCRDANVVRVDGGDGRLTLDDPAWQKGAQLACSYSTTAPTGGVVTAKSFSVTVTAQPPTSVTAPPPAPGAGQAPPPPPEQQREDDGTLSDAAKKEVEKIAAKTLKEELQSNKKFSFGFSVGLRYRTSQELVLADASILPTDGTLRGKEVDKLDTVVSVVFAAFPFKSWDWLGFLANIDLANYGPTVGAQTVFNRTVEGGVGLAWRPVDSFAIGATVERYSGRVPRDGIAVGQPVVVRDASGAAHPLETIDISDNNYFQDEALSGVSLKFIYFP